MYTGRFKITVFFAWIREQATFNIFRFEEWLIVEHWDNLQVVAELNPSGHTQFDGPIEVVD